MIAPENDTLGLDQSPINTATGLIHQKEDYEGGENDETK